MNQEYLEKVRSHFNEPILMCFDVARCVGYGEDDDDCYIIVRYPRRGLVWHTLVGGYYYLDCLKGQSYVKSKNGEDWDDFTRLDGVLSLNGAPREPEFICIDRSTYEADGTRKDNPVRLDNSVQENEHTTAQQDVGNTDGFGCVIAPV